MVRMPIKSGVWVSLFFLLSGTVAAQCGMGVPSAGNPNCIPPGMPGSPYVTTPKNNSRQPVYQQPIIIKHEWADRWGAMVVDNVHPVTGFSTGAASKSDAMRLAKADCLNKGGEVCDKLFAYRNQCAAMIAVKGGGVYYQSAPYVEIAEEAGMKRCADNKETCRVIYSNCSLPEAVPIR